MAKKKINFQKSNPIEQFFSNTSQSPPESESQKEILVQTHSISSPDKAFDDPDSKIRYKPNPLYLEVKSERKQFLLTPTNQKRLKKRALSLGTSMNELINQLIDQYIDQIRLK